LFGKPISANTLLEELFASLSMPYQIETAAMSSAIFVPGAVQPFMYITSEPSSAMFKVRSN
jgi:hypothetical protein